MMKKSFTPPQLKREILAIIFFTFGLAIVLSLVSYHAEDPSFSSYQSSSEKISNLLGVVGSYLSDFIYQFFGLSSFLFALILLQLSIRLFFTLQPPFQFLQGFVWLGLIFSTTGILSLSLGKITINNFSGNAGGVSGYIISDFLTRYLNPIGAYIFLLLIFVPSLMAVTNFSFFRTGNLFIIFFSSLKKGAVSLIKSRKKLTLKKTKVKQTLNLLPRTSWSKLSKNGEKPSIEPAIVTSAAVDKSLAFDADVSARQKQSLISDFKLPTLNLLSDPEKKITPIEKEMLIQNSRLLESKLADFGVKANVTNVHPGPVVTMYELKPAPGVKINRIVNLADDLALALRAVGIRIIAPIPGRGAIGVEIPNRKREPVCFKEIVGQKTFIKSDSLLTVGLGKNIAGMPIITDLSKMPHLLIAGTTGSGKTVFLNTLICSILFKAPPSKVKLLIMDPKRSELIFYEDIPHLLYPVVTDAKQATEALRWAVEEMERRYHLLAQMGTRDITAYNQKITTNKGNQQFWESNGFDPSDPPQPMALIVVVIDELANLMMIASREVELSLARLAQMARAAGIHLLIATQRPSVDVITGTIKANFPARISFRLTSKTDSRIIIDTNGAENLLNQGDMLFLSPRTTRLKRIHAPYISDDEIIGIVNFLKAQAKPEYQELHLKSGEDTDRESDGDIDEKYQEAVELVTSLGQASISMVQRKLRIGYNRSARIIEKMEKDGLVGPSDGSKPREVLRRMVDI
ncbi:MAG: DNA translocase FtsK 4TM domain-containing protein [Proteobacteria bacterium]|nr:DNA translocase FtsK 4TM domain-containing protein [Pseudomonadota bacterium]